MGSTRRRGGDRRRPDVLIPSSSGHGFNRGDVPPRRDSRRLNPFFIRAWVQPSPGVTAPGEGRGLNPFFIRAWVQPGSRSPRPSAASLNPFFIRAWVQPPAEAAIAAAEAAS